MRTRRCRRSTPRACWHVRRCVGLCPEPPAKAEPLQSIRFDFVEGEGLRRPDEAPAMALSLTKVKVKGSKGWALGGDARGRAPCWGPGQRPGASLLTGVALGHTLAGFRLRTERHDRIAQP